MSSKTTPSAQLKEEVKFRTFVQKDIKISILHIINNFGGNTNTQSNSNIWTFWLPFTGTASQH